jgi:hypothetical protein
VKPVADPQQARAYRLFAEAIRNGVLVPATACERCGAPPRGRYRRLDGHHHLGYADEFALVFRWLCNRCHRIEHPTWTPESVAKASRVAAAVTTPEQRRAWARQANATVRAKYSPEERAAWAREAAPRGGAVRAAQLRGTVEGTELGRRGAAAARAKLTKDDRVRYARAALAKFTAEERSALARKGWETRRAQMREAS